MKFEFHLHLTCSIDLKYCLKHHAYPLEELIFQASPLKNP